MKFLEILNLNSYNEEKRSTNLKADNNVLITCFITMQFTSLTELYLDNTKIDTSIIKEIVHKWKLTSLQLLSLKNCKYITGLALYHFHSGSNLTNLESLYLDSTNIDIKVETIRLLKQQMLKTYKFISFFNCLNINSEQLLKYISIPEIRQNLEIITLEHLFLDEQIALFIRNNTKIIELRINIENQTQLSAILHIIKTISCDNSQIKVSLVSRSITDSVLKHLFF